MWINAVDRWTKEWLEWISPLGGVELIRAVVVLGRFALFALWVTASLHGIRPRFINDDVLILGGHPRPPKGVTFSDTRNAFSSGKTDT